MPGAIEPKRKRATAKDAIAAFEAGANGGVSRQDVDAVVVQTRRGLRAASPLVAAALLDKAIRGRKSPTDTKAAMFLLSGVGITQTGAPVTEAERRAMDAENERLDAMPRGDLSRAVHLEAGITPVPEPK